MTKARYHHCGFVALRVPLLPRSQMTLEECECALGADNKPTDPESCDSRMYRDAKIHMAERLIRLSATARVHEALWLASPGFCGRLDQQRSDDTGAPRADTVESLYKYLVRASTRCTPFGTFSSCTYGVVGDRTQLALRGKHTIVRKTRLDSQYLRELIEYINSTTDLRNRVRYRINTSVYPVGNRIHYVETARTNGSSVIRYKLCSVAPTPYLSAVLELASQPIALGPLTVELQKREPDVSADDATDYINTLVDNQLLIPELSLSVTGGSPLRDIIHKLGDDPAASTLVETLNDICSALDIMDSLGIGQPVSYYETVTAQLKALPVPVNVRHLFQVDTSIASNWRIAVGEQLITRVHEAVNVLHETMPRADNAVLRQFAVDFARRYGARNVPLCEALDDEVGIRLLGSPDTLALTEPLLAGLRLRRLGSGGGSGFFTNRDAKLIEWVQGANPRDGLSRELSSSVVDELRGVDTPPLPDAWCAHTVVFNRPESATNDGYVWLKSASGPSAANLIGRFCYVDFRFADAVRHCLREEEDLHPDADYAEVVHVPAGRTGNILRRPPLRRKEVVYLSTSSADNGGRIGVQELLVHVRSGDIVLTSRRSGRRIVPRMASAHTFWQPINLPVYRFLCLLQIQGVQSALYWDWGAASVLDFLPRLVYQHVILSPATWRLRKHDVKEILQHHGLTQYRIVQEVRTRLMLPRRVETGLSDQVMQFDLACPTSVEAFCGHLRQQRSGVRLYEVLTDCFGFRVRIDGEAYCNELLIPFVKGGR